MWLLRISVLALLLGPTSSALAEADETVLWAGAQGLSWSRVEAGVTAPGTAAAGAVGVRYGLDDFWEVSGQLGGGANLAEGRRGDLVMTGSLEARYIIDALTWVPWVCAGAGGLARDGLDDQGVRLDLMGHLGVGVEYRPARDWGLSFATRLHAPLTDPERSSGPLEITLGYAWYLD